MKTLLKDIELNYGDLEVLKNFTLEVPKSRVTCIVGPSGCGKSSILNILADLNPHYKGYRSNHHNRIGYVFQEDRLLPWETVYDNIRLVRDDEDSQEIQMILRSLELTEFSGKYPYQLSGGMKQRVAIARGFYFHGSLLLMDEPFKSLDYDLRLNLIDYLCRLWNRTNNTIIFVTHDIDEALLLGHLVIVLGKRPASIVAKHVIEKDHEARDVMNEDHVKLRSQIIKQMTYEREHRNEKIMD